MLGHISRLDYLLLCPEGLELYCNVSGVYATLLKLEGRDGKSWVSLIVEVARWLFESAGVGEGGEKELLFICRRDLRVIPASGESRSL